MPRKSIGWAVLGLFLLSISSNTASAEWGLYNPFASKPAKKTAPKEPSTFAKVSDGTHQFFSKTADFLNPFDDADDKPQKNQEGSFWSSLFGPSDPEPLPAQTVDGFMSLPRP